MIARTSSLHSPGIHLDFEEVYRTHHEFVWRTLSRMGVGARDVKDAGQKVFLKAYQRMSEFEGRSSYKTWLCGIALRVASDYRRSVSARREVLVDGRLLRTFHEARQVQEIEQQERLAELDQVLSALPLEQRTVFVLFELEEMSGEEIANLTGVSEGTVRSRLRLARNAFLKIMALRHGDSVRVAVAGGAP